MLSQNIAESEFPIIDQLRAIIRAAQISPAGKAEIQVVSEHLSETLSNNLIGGFEPDREDCALDQLFKEERLPRVEVTRFYRQYIQLKFSVGS